MGNSLLASRSALDGLHLEFDHCVLTERVDLALISVAIPLGGGDALAAKISDTWGLRLPRPTLSAQSDDMRAMPLTADQFMLVFPPDATLTEASVQATLQDVGYTTVQTDAWVILELSGPGATTALERICPVDLDAAAFPVDAAARTTMEHLGALVLRTGADRFLLMSARSSAASFLHAVETSCRWTTP